MSDLARYRYDREFRNRYENIDLIKKYISDETKITPQLKPFARIYIIIY